MHCDCAPSTQSRRDKSRCLMHAVCNALRWAPDERLVQTSSALHTACKALQHVQTHHQRQQQRHRSSPTHACAAPSRVSSASCRPCLTAPLMLLAADLAPDFAPSARELALELASKAVELERPLRSEVLALAAFAVSLAAMAACCLAFSRWASACGVVGVQGGRAAGMCAGSREAMRRSQQVPVHSVCAADTQCGMQRALGGQHRHIKRCALEVCSTHLVLVCCLVQDEPVDQGVSQAHTQQQANPVGGVTVQGATAAGRVGARGATTCGQRKQGGQCSQQQATGRRDAANETAGSKPSAPPRPPLLPPPPPPPLPPAPEPPAEPPTPPPGVG